MTKRIACGLMAALLALAGVAPAAHMVADCRCAPAASEASYSCCPAEDESDACPLCLTSDQAPPAVAGDTAPGLPTRPAPFVAVLPPGPPSCDPLASGPSGPGRRDLSGHIPGHVSSTVLRV